jgi:hypothetical protein
MVTNDKQLADAVHMNIHAVRLLTGYKPSEFEKKISRIVLERFSDSCDECKKINELLKANPPQQKQSIFKKIGDAINASG